MAATVVETETETAAHLDVPWQVVVHDDPVNLMSYVTLVLRRIFGFNQARAEQHMLEVHRQGRSVVWCGAREPAEGYVEQLHAALLLATLEKSR